MTTMVSHESVHNGASFYHNQGDHGGDHYGGQPFVPRNHQNGRPPRGGGGAYRQHLRDNIRGRGPWRGGGRGGRNDYFPPQHSVAYKEHDLPENPLELINKRFAFTTRCQLPMKEACQICKTKSRDICPCDEVKKYLGK